MSTYQATPSDGSGTNRGARLYALAGIVGPLLFTGLLVLTIRLVWLTGKADAVVGAGVDLAQPS
jgi:hypothetical protein